MDNKKTLRKQANSRHCFVCGVENRYGLSLKFYETAPGEVTADYVAPEHFQSYPGVVHGGIVASMLDEITGRVYIGSVPPRFMYTAKLEIRYHKNVPVGKPIRLVGKAGISRGRTATASGAIYDEQDNLLAEAEALLVDVPADIIEGASLEELGWKVYPDE